MFGVEKRDDKYVSALLRRQRAIHVTATCAMRFAPEGSESAGMAVVQAMNHQYHLERALSDGKQVLRLVLCTAEYPCPPYFPGFTSRTTRKTVAEAAWSDAEVVLQIEMAGEEFTIRYGHSRDALTTLCVADGSLINPEKVGCMAGTTVGMFASGNGTDSDNTACFDWFELAEN